jgi:hypothetical protein
MLVRGGGENENWAELVMFPGFDDENEGGLGNILYFNVT